MTDELPAGWTEAVLSDVFDNLDSKRIPINSAERAQRLATAGDRYPYYGATGQVGEIDEFLFDGEAVLLGEDGAPFLDARKRKAYLVDGKYWVNNHAHILRAKSEMSNAFFCHQLNAIDYRPYVAGTTRLKLTQAAMNDIRLVVAPATEQQRIVSKIDELFSRIDEGERALERVQKLVERYRQSVLKSAVTGELTRDWRAAQGRASAAGGRTPEAAEKNKHQLESGEALLARILKARREAWEKAELDKMKAKGITPANDKWKQKYEEPISPETAELPELPEDWAWASLDQFAAPVERAIQSGPFGSNLLHSEFRPEGKLVIGIDNVRDGWYSRGSQNRISDDKFEQLQKYQARPKDFLITVMATIGRTCVLPDDIEPSIITKHVYRFTLDHNLVLPEFVNLCVMGSPAVRSQIFGNVRGQTRPGLNKSLLTQFGFPLPPIEEQRLILDRSAELLSRLAPNKETIDTQQLRSGGLRQAVLKAAFAGHLVSQDPTNEPAATLLERIAAERSHAPAKPRRGITRESGKA